MTTTTFQVWKKLGFTVPDDNCELVQSLANDGFRVNGALYSAEEVGAFALAPGDYLFELYREPVSTVAGKDLVTYPEARETLEAMGYQMCPPRLGIALRRAYPEQERTDATSNLLIMTEPFRESLEEGKGKDSLLILCLGRGQGEDLWLTTHYAVPEGPHASQDYGFRGIDELIFCKLVKPTQE